MRSIPVSEAKNRLSALLREVRGGATLVITDHGVPVARLSPLDTPAGLGPATIELAQRGRLVLPQQEPTAAWLSLPLASPREGASAVAALLDEREDAR